jgi:GNAT superfamily N-acetyltransferase
MDLRLYPLREDDFDRIIELGDLVQGKNYLNYDTISKIHGMSYSRGTCCSYVMYDQPREKRNLIGFRLTYGPGLWVPDEWCSVDAWGVAPEKVCYFKSNTIHPDYQGKGIGPAMLDVSIEAVKQMGAEAGVTHIWLETPNKSAYRYFAKTGAETLWIWPGRWKNDLETYGYQCVVCCADGQVRPCRCHAAEMMLYFGEQQ